MRPPPFARRWALALALAGCGNGPVAPPPDVPTADAAPDAPADARGACPPPARLTPGEVPAGYLPPETVGYVRTVDGDTAHFLFASGDQTLRFLFVNTEESHGAETTAFGVDTGRVVEGYLAGATALVVAVRNSTQTPGTPDQDIYGRWLGVVYVNGELLETRLIREGLSAYFTQFGCAPAPLHAAFVYAEAEARGAQRGIWTPGHPTNYADVLAHWIGNNHCRPNPYLEPYCP